jgi:hypothetical protein
MSNERAPLSSSPRGLGLLAAASLALAGCRPTLPPAEPVDAGPAPVALPQPLPANATPAQVAAAARLTLRPLYVPGAPLPRPDLRVDLASADFFGFVPGGPIAPVLQRLGQPVEKRLGTGPNLEVWRWPSLGAEVTVANGNVAVRMGLVARADADPGLTLFPGPVLVGDKPLLALAPHLTIQEAVKALGFQTARIHGDAAILEAGWAHGAKALFLVFDSETLLLESLQLEPFDAPLWDEFMPAQQMRDVWDRAPRAAPPKLP